MTASSIPLFGARRPTLIQARTRGDRGRPPVGRRGPDVPVGGCRGGGRHDSRAPEAGLAQLRLVERGHGQTERGARRQLAQLGLGQELVPRHAVVPRRVVLGRRDVVVVDDEGLGAGPEPGGDGRGGGELVDQHVARFGLFGVPAEGAGLGRRLRVVHLHVDVRGDAPFHQDVAQAQGVPSDRIGAVQHRDELVNARHDGVAAGVASGTSRSTKRSAAAPRSSSASRSPARRDDGVAAACVAQQRGDGRRQRVGVLVRHEHAGTAEHLGHRALVERHHRARPPPWPRRPARRSPRAPTSRPARRRSRRPPPRWHRWHGRRTPPRWPARARPRSGAVPPRRSPWPACRSTASVAPGSPWARATASAATVLSRALLGDTRPTANQRAPRAGAGRGAGAAGDPGMQRGRGRDHGRRTKPEAARCASL